MKGYFTTHQGKEILTSDKQHKFLHTHKLDHTHYLPNNTIIRHRFDEKGNLIKEKRISESNVYEKKLTNEQKEILGRMK